MPRQHGLVRYTKHHKATQHLKPEFAFGGDFASATVAISALSTSNNNQFCGVATVF